MIFDKIKVESPQSSTFDLSHDHKLSLKMGELVPVNWQECLPGDRWTMCQEAVFRLMPLLAPIMHRIDVYFHNFFVPMRILWANWETFLTGGLGLPGTPPDFPIMPEIDVNVSELGDYLGLPLGTGADAINSVSAIPFAAYQKIYRDYYMDQNLIGLDDIVLTDGAQSAPNTVLLTKIQKRAWEHDYFTSNLPWAQKGDAVQIPIQLTSDIVAVQPTGFSDTPIIRSSITGNPTTWPYPWIDTAGNSEMAAGNSVGVVEQVYLDPQGSLQLDNVQTLTTINELRTAYAVQRFLEKNALGGTRYTEMIRVHFDVKSSDARLQRSEYIGGSKTTMSISEVLQTGGTGTGVDTPQGNMAGRGISVSSGDRHSYFCEEHGILMCILSIKPKTSYQQGIHRAWRKFNRLDYYWPELAHLGEQEVKNWEIYHKPSDGDDDLTFGYLPAWSDYRTMPSQVSGQMRTTLDYWHYGRIFTNRPTLSQSFIEVSTDKRIFADQTLTDDEIVAHVYHSLTANRKIPYYGTPSGI